MFIKVASSPRLSGIANTDVYKVASSPRLSGIANTDAYKGSFFPQTTRDWNALPDSLISSAEDAEDCVAKFTRTNSLITGPGG